MKKVGVEPRIRSEGDDAVGTLQKIPRAGEVEGVVDVELDVNDAFDLARARDFL